MRSADFLGLCAVLFLVCAGSSPAAGQETVSPAPMESATTADVQEPAGPAPDAAPTAGLLLRVAVAVSVCALLLFAAVLFFEDRFVFHPRPAVDGPAPADLGVVECSFRARDGVRLHGWWHAGGSSGDGPDGAVLLWCHGNAGNIHDRADNLRMLAERGFGVFLFDYRGYGKSEGRPSEVGLYLDVEAAHRYVVKELGVAAERIVCFGRSLGAAVAVHCALRCRVGGLILEGAFESVPAMVRPKLLAPVSVLLRNRFDTLSRISGLKVPLLMLHGERDRVVPLAQGQSVFDAAPEPKDFHVVWGAGHEDVHLTGGEDYFGVIRDFCVRCARGKG